MNEGGVRKHALQCAPGVHRRSQTLELEWFTAQVHYHRREHLRRRNHSMRVPATLKLLAIAVAGTAAPAAEQASKSEPPKPTARAERRIEGWDVRIDQRLLAGTNSVLGERALNLLAARLVAIAMVMPEPSLTRLREVPIVLDLTHGGLRNMQYHPSAGWLTSHGYSEALAKCVHIPDVSHFLSPFENHRQPWAVLHELAHAYHDRVLGFDEPRIKAAWTSFRDAGRYQSVLTSPGGERAHYALTDPKEFFAEMTECYFGANDFYPFVAGELKQAEPDIFNLMRDIWGPLPRRP